MSTPNVANLLRVPGRLSHTPTSTTTLRAAYPHGGTALGTVGRLNLRPTATPFPLTAEEWGGRVVDLIDGGAGWVLDAELREWDADALAALFPFYATGAQGGPSLSFTVTSSSHRAGKIVGDSLSRVLVFTPDAPDHHPVLVARRAVPAVQESALLALRANETVGIAVRWYLTPDANGKVFDFANRRDVTL